MFQFGQRTIDIAQRMGWPLDSAAARRMGAASERFIKKAFHIALLHRHREGFDEFSVYRQEGRGLSEPETQTRRDRSQGLPQALTPIRRIKRK